MRIRWLTIDDTLVRTAGELRGLAMARVALVLLLVAFQSAQVSQSFVRIFATPLWIVPVVAASALFAPLGFVLAQAREREAALAFLARRARFGWPPLAAAVLLTLVVIGPAATTRGLGDYVRDGQTWLYLLNLIAVPQFGLPGVFEFNDLADTVNPILWMAPVYVILALLAAFTPLRLRTWIWGALTLALAAASVVAAVVGVVPPGGETISAYAAPMVGGLLCAVFGMLAYRHRKRVPLDWRLAMICGVIVAGAALVGNRFWEREPLVVAVLAAPVAYLALWATIRRSPDNDWWRRLQPYLAPLLLAAFPIQQAVVRFGPREQDAALNLLLSMPPILLFAGSVGQVLRIRRLAPAVREHPWAAVAVGGSRRRDPAMPMRERLRVVMWAALVGAVLIALTLAAFGLTLFAMQRDAGGV